MTSDLAARAKELSFLLTSWPSVTGSKGEAALPHLLAEHLAQFDRAWVAAVPDDPFGRSNVFALKRGRSTRTIVLTGHFDTVPFDDYSELAEFALQPDTLLARLVKKLPPSLALSDLESGVFLPGRGLLDMKAGLAAGIAAMEHYAGEATLLFIGVADEEERSAGARAAVPLLKAFVDEQGLEISLIINLDSISDQGDGSKGRVVTYGSIGKQLLCAHVVGKAAHAGYPQDGVNAAYVMAELVRAIELASQLSETTGDEVAALPATLFAKDGKQGYNVTTPANAFAYWNTMQHRRSGAEVLDIAMALATKAVAEAEKKTGQKIALHRAADFVTPKMKADPKLSLPEQSRMAFEQLVRDNAIEGPGVIMGFGSIPYPAVLLKNQTLRKTIADAVKPFGLGEVNYFAGISDVSFYGEAADDLSTVAANTPIWGQGFVMPEPGGWPTINIGPWGRDYHTPLERLHAPYAFETLPRVLLSAIDAVAKLG
jgi:arginine utilization protein RocB